MQLIDRYPENYIIFNFSHQIDAMVFIPDYVKKDPYLMPYASTITGRLRKAHAREQALLAGQGKLAGQDKLAGFAMGHHHFGLHKDNGSWRLREWAPNATAIFVVGEFSAWAPAADFAMTNLGGGQWELILPADLLSHGTLYKLHMCWEGGSGDRIPAWANRVVQDPVTHIFNAQVWDPPAPYHWKCDQPAKQPDCIKIYEAHVGMATEEYKVGSWDEFRTQRLPRIAKAGYNVLQMMAVQEHPYYGSFGYHVSSFFAASSRFGTPEELKALIDDAHGLGMHVVVDIVHSHAVKNEVEGISRYDGSSYQFFHDGPRGDHPAWDSRCFNYSKDEVLHFLLSNCRFWLEEFRFDGFRFDGVTSMLYLDHGLGTNFVSYEQYFDLNQDEDALVYLYLANKLIHEINPAAITIAEEMSGMPGLAVPVKLGGIGFDFRLAMGVPDFWIKTIKEKKLEFWHVGDIFHRLTAKRAEEKTIHYAESHDQALVGDKTIIFWLMDKEMYFDMHISSQNLVVDNGMALHRMIRLITFCTAGNGYLNFMGNEFGHPEWIDFPRESNNWSFHYARRQWSLADHPELKYRLLADFDRDMLCLCDKTPVFHGGDIRLIHEHISDQVIVFCRGDLVFVFNFSPFRSYEGYVVNHLPAGVYSVVLNTDSTRFGGVGRLDESMDYVASDSDHSGKTSMRIYIPSLSGFVIKKK